MTRRNLVLLTGASSFTGAAIAERLVGAGYEVAAPLPRADVEYEGLRRRRIESLRSRVNLVFEAPVGSARFRDVVKDAPRIDAFLIHHAVVEGYRSGHFDVGAAVASATSGAHEVAESLAEHGCQHSVLTRSVFEAGLGISSDPRPIGAYAVAKTASVDTWTLALAASGIPVRHFTITNPVGALEEPRFVSYLARSWKAGGIPELRAPHLVRDNVPIDLLAASYVDFVGQTAQVAAHPLTPSFWVGSNLSFAQRVSREFSVRSGLPCPVAVASEIDESEPYLRVGTDLIKPQSAWNEAAFWDTYADHYDMGA